MSFSPSKRRRARKHARAKAKFNRLVQATQMVFFDRFPTVIKGKQLKITTPYYAKPKPYDLPERVEVWKEGLRMVNDRQEKVKYLVTVQLKPYRLSYGDVGKSKHSKFEFQSKDARKHVLTVLKPAQAEVTKTYDIIEPNGTVHKLTVIKKHARPTTYHDKSKLEPHNSECIIKGLSHH